MTVSSHSSNIFSTLSLDRAACVPRSATATSILESRCSTCSRLTPGSIISSRCEPSVVVSSTAGNRDGGSSNSKAVSQIGSTPSDELWSAIAIASMPASRADSIHRRQSFSPPAGVSLKSKDSGECACRSNRHHRAPGQCHGSVVNFALLSISYSNKYVLSQTIRLYSAAD